MRLLKRVITAVTRPGYAFQHILQGRLFNPAINRTLERLGGVSLMARLTNWSIDCVGWRPGRDTVLVLDRLYFSKDVTELRRLGACNYVNLHTHVLSVTQANWLPEELQEQISYWPRTRPEHAAAWAKAEAYADAVLTQARQRFGAKAVLASNVDYWQHESFRRACQRQGIPFLVLCQEQQTVPFTYDVGLKLYRDADFRYTGTAVAVFEGRTRDMLIECDCCTPDQVAITGAPRLDPWFDGTVKPAPADTITLLAYDGDQYFAPNCYLEALRVFADASLAHGDKGIDFVLKCKDAEDQARAIGHLEGVDHRLVLTHERTLPELFSRSRLVMGYNTLAILEALLSPAEIAVPAWSDADRPRAEQIVDTGDAESRKHYLVLDGPEAWRAMLDHAVATPRPAVDTHARRQLLRRWFHVPEDGCASRAVEAFIRSYFVGGSATPTQTAMPRAAE